MYCLAEIEAVFEFFSDPTEERFEELQKSFEGKSDEEKKQFDKISEFYFKHFVSQYGVDQAEEAFFSVLKEAMLDNEKNSDLVLEKFEELHEIYQKFKEVFGDETKIKFYPAFLSGAVAVKVQNVSVNKDGINILKDFLSKCNTFEVDPLLDGNLDIAVTVKGLFKSKTE